jgi:hypothetical protein
VTGGVAVCADESPAGRRALRWAAAEARRRALPLQIVAAGPTHPRSARNAILAGALATVGAAVAGLPVLSSASREPVPATLRRRSAGAATLVVPATLPELATVVADAHCPVVTVPAHDPSREAEHGPVVVAAAPWTTEAVIGRAFHEASERKTSVRAVRVWSEPRVDLGWLRADRIAEWDSAEEGVRHELELALSAWTIIHPEVRVETMIVQDRPASFLVAISHSAQLLVLGRAASSARVVEIAGSPIDALLRSSACPVMIVPSDGPPRSTLLPTRERAKALAGH